MMYCLRRFVRSDGQPITTNFALSYIPLLLLPIPLSLSPVHLAIFLAITYFLNRPCVYCTLLLIILFTSSCHWSTQWSGSYASGVAEEEEGIIGYLVWWLPRVHTFSQTEGVMLQLENASLTGTALEMMNRTARDFAQSLSKSHYRNGPPGGWSAGLTSIWNYLRNFFDREWVVPCIGVKLML